MRRVNWSNWGRAVGVVMLAAWVVPASAQQADPHQLYERSCAGCHAPHAGDFVFQSLTATGTGLVGKNSGRPLRAFLQAGHGRLTPAEVETMLDHLQSIQRSGRLFHKKCKICHVSPIELAQLELTLRDGRLVGRYTGRDIAQFLLGHGRLSAAEVPVVVDVLQRQLAYKSE